MGHAVFVKTFKILLPFSLFGRKSKDLSPFGDRRTVSNEGIWHRGQNQGAKPGLVLDRHGVHLNTDLCSYVVVRHLGRATV